MAKNLTETEFNECKGRKKINTQLKFQDYLDTERKGLYTIITLPNENPTYRNSNGTGIVYFAVKQDFSKTVVAIKQTRLDQIVSSQGGKKEFREIKTIKKLYYDTEKGIKSCPYIAALIDDPWIKKTTEIKDGKEEVLLEELITVTEYVPNQFEKLREEKLDEKKCLDVFIKLCTGLEHIHQNLVHRDIKPENIRYDTDEKTGEIIPKIIDFGLACGLTTSVGVVGTPGYIAPEGRRADSKPTVDIYSLGVVLWELINKRGAYAAEEQMAIHKAKYFETQPNLKCFEEKLDRRDLTPTKEMDKDAKTCENIRKHVVQMFIDNMKCGNEYIKEIIKKAMNPEAEINPADPKKNIRYQSAREIKTDLVIAQRMDNLADLARQFNALNVDNIQKKVRKCSIDFKTEEIERAYKLKWEFCQELLQAVGDKYEITEDDLAKSYLLSKYTDEKVMPIFGSSLQFVFGKKPDGLEITRFKGGSPKDERTHYELEKKNKVDTLDKKRRQDIEEWSAVLRDLKHKCKLQIEV